MRYFTFLAPPSSEIYVLHSASQIGLTTFQELSNHVATALDPAVPDGEAEERDIKWISHQVVEMGEKKSKLEKGYGECGGCSLKEGGGEG